MPTRNADAVWTGGLKGGSGCMHTQTGACEGRYSAASRFEEGEGTNPEELIGAAHAGCFSMALALILEEAGHPPERIETKAHVHIENVGGAYAITGVELETQANVPGLSEQTFLEKAEIAKRECPVSKALMGTEISLKAQLTD